MREGKTLHPSTYTYLFDVLSIEIGDLALGEHDITALQYLLHLFVLNRLAAANLVFHSNTLAGSKPNKSCLQVAELVTVEKLNDTDHFQSVITIRQSHLHSTTGQSRIRCTHNP